MHRLIVCAFALVAVLAVACGGDGSSANPTASPQPPEPTPTTFTQRPPALTLTAGGTAAEASVGTFCWRGLCLDMAGPVTPQDPTAIQAGNLTATLADGTIAEASASALLVGGDNPPTSQEADIGLLVWTGGDAPEDLPSQLAGDSLSVDLSGLAAGRYVLSFFVRFEDGGDASYGLLVDLSPAAGG